MAGRVAQHSHALDVERMLVLQAQGHPQLVTERGGGGGDDRNSIILITYSLKDGQLTYDWGD